MRPRRSGSCRDPRRANRGRTHLTAAGRCAGDSTPGSGGWLRRTTRRFCFPLRKAFPAPRQPVGFAHCTTTGLMSRRSCPLPPPKTQGREPGRGCCPCCGFSVHPVAISGENLYVGVGGGVKRFLVCHVGKRRPSREIRLENNLGPLGKRAKVLKFWGPDDTMLTRTPE